MFGRSHVTGAVVPLVKLLQINHNFIRRVTRGQLWMITLTGSGRKQPLLMLLSG